MKFVREGHIIELKGDMDFSLHAISLLTHWQVYQFVTSNKVKMKVKVWNPHKLWLYLSDANPIIK